MLAQLMLPAVVIGICMLIARILLRRGKVRWSIAFGVVGIVATLYLLYLISGLSIAGNL